MLQQTAYIRLLQPRKVRSNRCGYNPVNLGTGLFTGLYFFVFDYVVRRVETAQ